MEPGQNLFAKKYNRQRTDSSVDQIAPVMPISRDSGSLGNALIQMPNTQSDNQNTVTVRK